MHIMILNNVREHNCFVIQGSYIGYMFWLIDQSSSGLFSRLSHKVLCTHWNPNVCTSTKCIKSDQLCWRTLFLTYGAEIWSLYEDDRRRINATEMDALRQSARTSKLDRKTIEYIRGKMDAQGTILDEITRKQLIWYSHVERMDPTRLPKILIHWKPEGRKKRGRPQRTWKDGIFTAMNEEI